MGFFDFFRKSKPSPDAFAKLYLKYITDRKLVANINYAPEKFAFMISGQMQHTFSLDNVYRDYCNAASNERNNVLRRYSETLKFEAVPETWNDVCGQLMPSIRPAAQLAAIRLSGILEQGHTKGYDNFLIYPFSDDARMMIAHDREDTLALVNKDTAMGWGVSMDQVAQAGLDNLRDRSIPKFRNLGDGVLIGAWDDAYDSSRILLSDVLNRAGVGNDPVIMISTRSCLLVASHSNVAAHAQLIDWAAQSIERDGRFISALMYQYRDGKLSVFESSNEVVRQKQHELQIRSVASEYHAQKEMLDNIHKKNGKDLFTASFQAFQSKKRGSLVSMCTWTDGTEGYIPKVDLIAFVRLNKSEPDKPYIKMITWDAAAKIAEGLMIQEQDCYPPLYRFHGFPSIERLAGVADAEI